MTLHQNNMTSTPIYGTVSEAKNLLKSFWKRLAVVRLKLKQTVTVMGVWFWKWNTTHAGKLMKKVSRYGNRQAWQSLKHAGGSMFTRLTVRLLLWMFNASKDILKLTKTDSTPRNTTTLLTEAATHPKDIYYNQKM